MCGGSIGGGAGRVNGWVLLGRIVTRLGRGGKLKRAFARLLICAFACSLVRVLACLLICAFAHSLVRAFVRSLVVHFHTHSLVHTFARFLMSAFPSCMHLHASHLTILVS